MAQSLLQSTCSICFLLTVFNEWHLRNTSLDFRPQPTFWWIYFILPASSLLPIVFLVPLARKLEIAQRDRQRQSERRRRASGNVPCDDAQGNMLGQVHHARTFRWPWVLTYSLIALVTFLLETNYWPNISIRPGQAGELHHAAMVPQIQVYDTKYPLVGYWDRELLGEPLVSPKAEMWRRIQTGLPQHETYACPTLKCTWDTFSTLGVCSSCEQVTSRTTSFCTTLEQWTVCNYTTPSGLKLSSIVGGVGANTLVDSTSQYQTDEQFADTTIVTIATLIYPETRQGWPTMRSIESQGEISECRLSWCMQTYHNVTYENKHFDPGTFVTTKLPFTKQSSYLVSKAPQVMGKAVGLNNTFYVRIQAALDMSVALGGLFDSDLFSGYERMGDEDSQVLASALYRASNVDEVVHQVADAMTEQVRMRDNRNEFCGRPHWTELVRPFPWASFALPLFVLAMGKIHLMYELGRVTG